jgi:hypothetical protein
MLRWLTLCGLPLGVRLSTRLLVSPVLLVVPVSLVSTLLLSILLLTLAIPGWTNT